MQTHVGILTQMVNSRLKVSTSGYSDYSNGESLNSGEFCTKIETVMQGDNDPCRGLHDQRRK